MAEKEKNNRSQSFISNGSGHSNDNPNDITTREETKIKDLLIKIQILKAGVLDERKKNSELEMEIKKYKHIHTQYEDNLTQKENEIINLTKEKYDLQSALSIERKRNEEYTNQSSSNNFTNIISNIFNMKELTTQPEIAPDLKRIQNESKELQYENEILKHKLSDAAVDFDKCKQEYQNLINLQMAKIKTLEGTTAEKNHKINELTSKLDNLLGNLKNFDVERTKYESRMGEHVKLNTDLESKVVELLLRLEEKENVIDHYKQSLSRHEIESGSLARKLAELKNAILESNMVIQTFKCEKIGSLINTTVEILFGRTEDNEYVMIVKENGKEDVINIEDVEYVKICDTNTECIDVCYSKNGKLVKLTVIVPRYKMNNFFQAHKDYLQKAIKMKNGILY